MAKAGGANTGRGNYGASRVSGSFKQLKEGLAGAPKIKHPNREISTMQYKKSLKKEPESNA